MNAWMIWFGLMLSGPDTVVVCPPPARAAIAPWIERRTAQGYRITVVAPRPTARETREVIRRIAKTSILRTVVLVGDARGPIAVPTFGCPSPVGHRFGGTDRVASDNPYSDLDDDGIPDLAIGRFSVANERQLRDWYAKIVDFEQGRGPWRTRIELVAGVGGFSPLLDHAIDRAVARLLARSLPATYTAHLTQADWRSPFCPDPRHFHRATRRSLDRGSLFWIYMGHGHPFGLDRVAVPGAHFPIMSIDHIEQLDYQTAPSIAVLFACYTGAFYAEESFAEKLVRHRRGPVSALAASGVAMPYGMALLGDGMAHAFFEDHQRTLGDVVFEAKRSLVDQHALARRQWLHWSARLLSPNRNALDAERREQIVLFQLLGDPLLQLPAPERIELTGPDRARAGQSIELTANMPFPGRGHIELVAGLEQHRSRWPRRHAFHNDPRELERYDTRYAKANNRVLRKERVTFEQTGPRTISLRLPDTARGAAHVVIYTESSSGRFAVGQLDLRIDGAARNVARETSASPMAGG